MFIRSNYLNPEDVNETVKNIRTTSNGLVKRVLAEETTYTEECKKLMKYDKKEFYQKRTELIDALNLYKFNPYIDGEEKTNLNYELIHSELKELRNKKRKWNFGTAGLFLGTAGFFTLMSISIITVSPLLAILGYFGGWGGLLTGVGSIAKRPDIGSFLVHHVALVTYSNILGRSQNADNFMNSVSFLKDIHPDYKDSDIDNLYRNNTEEFIDHFSNLKDVKEKKKIITLIYDSKYKNDEVISWLDANELKLVRDAALENF